MNQSQDLSSDDIEEVIKELKNLKIKKTSDEVRDDDDEGSGCRKHSTCEEYEWHTTKNSHCGKCHHPGTNDKTCPEHENATVKRKKDNQKKSNGKKTRRKWLSLVNSEGLFNKRSNYL